MDAQRDTGFLALTPEMILATNTVVFLSMQQGCRARATSAAVALGVSGSDPLWRRVLDRLSRGDIIRAALGDPEEVCELQRPTEVTLSHVAAAVGDWLLIPNGKLEPGAPSHDLGGVYSRLRAEIMDGFSSLSVHALAERGNGAKPDVSRA